MIRARRYCAGNRPLSALILMCAALFLVVSGCTQSRKSPPSAAGTANEAAAQAENGTQAQNGTQAAAAPPPAPGPAPQIAQSSPAPAQAAPTAATGSGQTGAQSSATTPGLAGPRAPSPNTPAVVPGNRAPEPLTIEITGTSGAGSPDGLTLIFGAVDSPGGGPYSVRWSVLGTDQGGEIRSDNGRFTIVIPPAGGPTGGPTASTGGGPGATAIGGNTMMITLTATTPDGGYGNRLILLSPQGGAGAGYIVMNAPARPKPAPEPSSVASPGTAAVVPQKQEHPTAVVSEPQKTEGPPVPPGGTGNASGQSAPGKVASEEPAAGAAASGGSSVAASAAAASASKAPAGAGASSAGTVGPGVAAPAKANGGRSPASASAGQVPATKDAPAIAISSPANDHGFYRDELLIEGKVQDDDKDPRTVVGISSFTYHVQEDPSLKGPVFWDFIDGSFFVSLPAKNLAGTKTLILDATDTNGHTTQKTVVLYDGNAKPTIIMQSPADQSRFGDRFTIRGRMFDPSPDLGQPRGIAEATYDIMPTNLLSSFIGYHGDLTLDANGNFSLVVLTGELKDQEEVDIKAVGANGSEQVQRIMMDPAATGIPTLKATAGNSQVHLEWDPVPFAEGYDVYYSDNGAEPGPQNGEQVSVTGAQATVAGITNGDRYSFRVVAHSKADVAEAADIVGIPEALVAKGVKTDRAGHPAGAGTIPLSVELSSPSVAAIPLAPDTLAPTVVGAYGQVRLTWNSIPGANEFNVLRAAAENGPYFVLATVRRTPDYVDRDVRYGQTYYYRIAPVFPGSAASAARTGTTTALPPSPFLAAGQVDLPGVLDVTSAGNYVVAATTGGVSVVDAYDPKHPEVVSNLALSGMPQGDVRPQADGNGTGGTQFSSHLIVADSTTIFVAAGANGVKAVDITDPHKPVLASSLQLGNTQTLRALALGRNRYLLAGTRSSGVRVVAAADPRSLKLVSSFGADSGGGDVRSIAISPTATGAAAIAAVCGPTGIALFDLASITQPRPLGAIDLAGVTDAEFYSVGGSQYLATIGKAGLALFRLRTPASNAGGSTVPVTLVPAGTVGSAAGTQLSLAETQDGKTYAFVAGRDARAVAYDISDPAHPAEFAPFGAEGTRTVEVDHDITGRQFAYTADPSNLQVLDVFNIGRSLTVTSLTTHGAPQGIAVAKDPEGRTVAFVPAASAGVEVYRSGTPASLDTKQLLLTLPAADARDVVLRTFPGTSGAPGRSLLYVADAADGVVVFDVSGIISGSGDAPKKAGAFQTDGDVAGVTVQMNEGGRTVAYVSDRKAGLLLLDVTDPARISQLGAYTSPDARGAAVSGSTVYLADFVEGLVAIDVSAPEHPRRLGSVGGMNARSVAVLGSDGSARYAVVVGLDGMHVIDVADRGSPAQVAFYASDSAETALVAGTRIFLADGFRGMEIFDASDPRHPRKISSSDVTYAGRVATDGAYAYVTNDNGVSVVEILIPEWVSTSR